MALFLISVIVGGLWAGAVLVLLGRLVAWRWPGSARDKPKKKQRGGAASPHVSAAAFLVPVVGILIVTGLIADGVLSILSDVIGVPGQGTLAPFAIGVAGALVVFRARLPLIACALVVAVREVVSDRAKVSEQGRTVANVAPIARRRRKTSVPSSLDVQVDAVTRVIAANPTQASNAPVVVVTVPRAQRHDEPTLQQHRQALVVQLRARVAVLAAKVARPATPLIPAPTVEEPAAASLASQTAATIAQTKAQHEIWRAEAEAQRALWRQAGETQRAQWREEAQMRAKGLEKKPASDPAETTDGA